MKQERKGAITMTDVLINVENIIDDYEDKNNEKINVKIECFLILYRLRKMMKTEFAQKIIKENVIKDKGINNGKCTIKGTRITPNDIGKIIVESKNITMEKIFEEFPSLENENQILAGLFVFIKENITFKKVLFGK